jgi:nitrous oxidase accessory protein NosD
MDSQNCLVQNNKPHSIILSSSNHNKICQNFISGSGQALQLTTSSYNDIYANSILNSKNSSEAKGLNYSGKNPTAIVFGYTDEGVSQYNSVHGNLLVNHGVGIQCSNVKDISIYANVIEGCNCAISLNTDNNNIYQNNLTDNLLAISICGSHNAIYHNNFLNNTNQVSIRDEYYFTSNLIVAYSTNNTFDQGPTGGNYWSTFNGVDSDGNGISETPYKIDNRTVDNHPFMNPLPVSLPTLPTQSQPQPEPYPTPTATNINPEQLATPLMTDSTWAIIVIVAAVLVAVLVANWTLKKRTTKFDA